MNNHSFKTSCIKMILGGIRYLSVHEKQNYKLKEFEYVTTGDFYYEDNKGRCITIPVGFCSDGSSGGPDWGFSWLFHDYLYSSHHIDSRPLTRHEADEIMYCILEYERQYKYKIVFYYLSKLNIFWKFDKAWKKSGNRGAIFLE